LCVDNRSVLWYSYNVVCGDEVYVELERELWKV